MLPRDPLRVLKYTAAQVFTAAMRCIRNRCVVLSNFNSGDLSIPETYFAGGHQTFSRGERPLRATSDFPCAAKLMAGGMVR